MTTEPEVVPLSPLSFLERAADVFPDKPAITTASGWTQSYSEFRAEAGRVAERLRKAGVGRGDTVAVLARNGPDALLMHYAVPGAKAALVALNTRLAPQEYEYILLDSGADVLFVEPALSERIRPIAGGLLCQIVELPDADSHSESSTRSGHRVRRMARWRCPGGWTARSAGRRTRPHRHQLHERHHGTTQRGRSTRIGVPI